MGKKQKEEQIPPKNKKENEKGLERWHILAENLKESDASEGERSQLKQLTATKKKRRRKLSPEVERSRLGLD
jgi:hypothetical protein